MRGTPLRTPTAHPVSKTPVSRRPTNTRTCWWFSQIAKSACCDWPLTELSPAKQASTSKKGGLSVQARVCRLGICASQRWSRHPSIRTSAHPHGKKSREFMNSFYCGIARRLLSALKGATIFQFKIKAQKVLSAPPTDSLLTVQYTESGPRTQAPAN